MPTPRAVHGIISRGVRLRASVPSFQSPGVKPETSLVTSVVIAFVVPQATWDNALSVFDGLRPHDLRLLDVRMSKTVDQVVSLVDHCFEVLAINSGILVFRPLTYAV